MFTYSRCLLDSVRRKISSLEDRLVYWPSVCLQLSSSPVFFPAAALLLGYFEVALCCIGSSVFQAALEKDEDPFECWQYHELLHLENVVITF